MILDDDVPVPPRPLAERLLGAAKAVLARTVDAVLPPVCLACRMPVADPHALCARCWVDLRLIERPYCERLGIPFGYDLGAGALSAEAIARPPPYDRARTAVLFDGKARDLVHDLKYNDRPDLGRFMGRLMARAGRDVLPGADLLVPVPLHPHRLLQRRFNQSQILAAGIARVTGLPVDALSLERVKATAAQVGLTGEQRRDNLQGAFKVKPTAKALLAGRAVVLVDDVLTTGATVEAATRALRRVGVRSVDVLTFARVAGAGALHI
jgi:ComF family protein